METAALPGAVNLQLDLLVAGTPSSRLHDLQPVAGSKPTSHRACGSGTMLLTSCSTLSCAAWQTQSRLECPVSTCHPLLSTRNGYVLSPASQPLASCRLWTSISVDRDACDAGAGLPGCALEGSSWNVSTLWPLGR